MDSSSRSRMLAPQNAQRAQDPARTNISSAVGEIGGLVDQLALLQNTLQNGATPTMIAGFAMIIAQMQAQADYPAVHLTITSSIGPLERSATFSDGTWLGYDLTHNLIDPRSYVVFREPTRPPMDQERSLLIFHAAMQPITRHSPITPIPPIDPVRFRFTLPIVLPPVLTPPVPLASEGVRLTTHPTMNYMTPSTFQRGGVQGVQANATADNTTLSEEKPRESCPARTVRFQDSYDELIQSCSKHEPPKTEPAPIVGYQRDPQMQERQREQQKAENEAASTVIDLRETINAGKRAREEAEQSSSATTPTPTSSCSIAHSTRSKKTESDTRAPYIRRNSTAGHHRKRRSASSTRNVNHYATGRFTQTKI